MPDILHRIEAKTSAAKAYDALTTRDGLARWWTTDTQGSFELGGVIEFRFGSRGFIHMKVIEREAGQRVLWQVVDGPSEWLGSRVRFDLEQDGEHTAVLFQHQGWKEASRFMHHCSTKWALFLMSLKSLLETGHGAAYPNDVHVTCKAD